MKMFKSTTTEGWYQRIVEDATERLGAYNFRVDTPVPTMWPDSALGVYEDGVNYNLAFTPGFIVSVKDNRSSRVLTYHTDDRDNIALAEDTGNEPA